MSGETRELLTRLCSEARDYLFTYDGKRVLVGRVDTTYRKICRSVGIYDLNFHALRHTFGTRLGERDVNLKKIARLMGHTTTKHTEVYVHTSDEGLARAIECASSQSQIRTTYPEIRIAESA